MSWPTPQTWARLAVPLTLTDADGSNPITVRGIITAGGERDLEGGAMTADATMIVMLDHLPGKLSRYKRVTNDQTGTPYAVDAAMEQRGPGGRYIVRAQLTGIRG